jgi:hypothetical protein
LFQKIVAGDSKFAEVEFSHQMHYPKFVIPPALSEVEGTGEPAPFAGSERRNLSATSDFGLRVLQRVLFWVRELRDYSAPADLPFS